jgi:hypothetical protein
MHPASVPGKLSWVADRGSMTGGRRAGGRAGVVATETGLVLRRFEAARSRPTPHDVSALRAGPFVSHHGVLHKQKQALNTLLSSHAKIAGTDDSDAQCSRQQQDVRPSPPVMREVAGTRE